MIVMDALLGLAYVIVWAGAIFLLWPLARRAAVSLLNEHDERRNNR